MRTAYTALHFYHEDNVFFSKVLSNFNSKKQEANKPHNDSEKKLEPPQLDMHFKMVNS